MNKLIMGLDGGGTKSHLTLFRMDGTFKAAFSCGNLNHENMAGSFAQLESELPSFLHNSLKDSGACIGDVAYAVIGLAGVDNTGQHRIVSDILTRAGLDRFTLCNDAYLGVSAGCKESVGICAINGTGSTMAAIDRTGALQQVCGIGNLSNDCGGGWWYAFAALGAVYGELFKSEPKTALSQILFDIIGISKKEDYFETITAKYAAGTIDYAALNRSVFVAASMGDNSAIKILEQSAGHYAGGIAYLISEMDFGETVNVTLAGSIFVKEKVDILPKLIESKVREKLGLRPVVFGKLDVPPVAGAVFWAAKEAGVVLDRALVRAALLNAGL